MSTEQLYPNLTFDADITNFRIILKIRKITKKKRVPYWCGTLMTLFEYSLFHCIYVTLHYITFGASSTQDILDMLFYVT